MQIEIEPTWVYEAEIWIREDMNIYDFNEVFVCWFKVTWALNLKQKLKLNKSWRGTVQGDVIISHPSSSILILAGWDFNKKHLLISSTDASHDQYPVNFLKFHATGGTVFPIFTLYLCPTPRPNPKRCRGEIFYTHLPKTFVNIVAEMTLTAK